MLPCFTLETKLGSKVVGVDEVGRGSIAGPVVAAAIIIDESALVFKINDSKKLSKNKREEIYKILINNYPYTIAVIEPKIVDEINVLQATLLAMRQCIDAMTSHYDHILVDGNIKPIKKDNCHAIINGDATSASIAAASIIAKVYRDQMMLEMSAEYPFYGWEKNSGYGTILHFKALEIYGITPIHRKTFLRKFLQNK